MFRRIPAPLAEVETAAKGNDLVHHDQFLVLGGADGVGIIHVEMHPRVGFPVQRVKREGFALQHINHGEIPAQDIYLDAPLPGDMIQQGTQLVGMLIRLALSLESQLTVDIPAEDKHRMARLENGLPHGAKIRGTVDRDRDPGGHLPAPAVIGRGQYRRCRIG